MGHAALIGAGLMMDVEQEPLRSGVQWGKSSAAPSDDWARLVVLPGATLIGAATISTIGDPRRVGT